MSCRALLLRGLANQITYVLTNCHQEITMERILTKNQTSNYISELITIRYKDTARATYGMYVHLLDCTLTTQMCKASVVNHYSR